MLPKGSDVEPRGAVGILERLPTLDLEANEEFLASFRVWVNGPLSRAAVARANGILKDKGIDPKSAVSTRTALDALTADPVIAVRNHTWSRCQHLTWQNLHREFHANYTGYMAEMEAADNRGPGTLEINPTIVTPDYAKHEFHTQPGGYVGDPFAGHLYHYLTNNFNEGRNNQDEQHTRLAMSLPTPADGQVKRILDLGCGIGRQTLALKRRFPDAEIWGIDIAAPKIRYGHMRAVDLGVEVHFRHGLAEDSKFPDNHFDMIASYLLHHEIPASATLAAIKEVHRILRPGGLYYPVDFYTAGRTPPSDAYSRLRDWVSHRWVHEPWMLEYREVDLPAELTKLGFDVAHKGAPGTMGGQGNLTAVKKA
ncbi:MAG: class I SAM-dependent methyltransferase [Alphaproteobacteria bacterium]|nr:class I SAM-dependent methyltransferase [Alphaproteobacteria bacterium]